MIYAFYAAPYKSSLDKEETVLHRVVYAHRLRYAPYVYRYKALPTYAGILGYIVSNLEDAGFVD